MSADSLARRADGPFTSSFHRDVVQGLSARPKRLAAKYFYDAEGSRLFDRICEQPEYYPTRTELQIMQDHVLEMADLLGPRVTLLELGSGSSSKTRLLLDHLASPRAYVPIDISESHLQEAAARIAAAYPQLQVLPLSADFTEDFALPTRGIRFGQDRIAAYFPGSTLGNLPAPDAARLLRRIRRLVSVDGGLLMGLDMKKDVDVLERAYNDAEGVTAAFNRNMLARINRDLNADFDLDQFEHLAFYNAAAGRMEMHLRSRRPQTVRIGRHSVRFEAGETIHTENSHKYSAEDIAALARDAGFDLRARWQDAQGYFSVVYLVPAAESPRS